MDLEAIRGKRASFQVLRGVITGTGAQRREQQFRRRHASILAAVRRRLVRHHAMPARDGFESGHYPIPNADFHVTSTSGDAFPGKK